jgi:pimeloyl-ACP methyl ester carboxylesterase
MYRSAQGLAEDIVAAGVAPAVAKAPAGATAPARPIAVVGVHGISPIQQYAFQDQLAMGFLGYLNAAEAAASTGRTWFSTTYWPRVAKDPSRPQVKPSALRLYRDDERDPENPVGRVYDVYEGYWSPFSKGKTNIASLLTWLLRCTFLATSSTARVPATWRKLFWDVGYLVGALLLAAVFLVLAFVAGSFAWAHFAQLFVDSATPRPGFLEFAFSPFAQMKIIPWTGWLQLAVDVVLAYLVVQLVVVARTRAATHSRTAELRRDGRKGGRFETQTIAAESFHVFAAVLLTVFVVLLVLGDLWMLQRFHPDHIVRIMWHGMWLVLAVGFFQAARGLADFVVLDVLGDVQVYCTHDCNSAFYAVRAQIIDAVTKALLGPLNAVAPKATEADGDLPLYEKIHVAGHSLGTTVGLDVLIRLRQLVEEGSVDVEDWQRLRSFTTFGTALEKTRFLLDVRNPTVSAAQQQWQNDAYGRFFTDHRTTLAQPNNEQGVFWSNHWYFHDIVSNEIVSYKSDVEPGESFASWMAAPHEHAICENNRIAHPKPFWAFVHSDYIGDPLFWKNVGPVFTS